MYLKSLCIAVIAGMPLLAQAYKPCAQDTVDTAYIENRLLMADGPIPASTSPIDHAKDRLIGGEGSVAIGSASLHQVQFHISAIADRTYFGFGPEAVKEQLQFENYHCHTISEFSGLYRWNDPKKIWINENGIGLRVRNAEYAPLAQASEISVSVSSNIADSRLSDIEDSVLIVDQRRISLTQKIFEDPTPTFLDGLGPSKAQNQWIENQTPQVALDFLEKTLNKDVKWYDLIWLMPRLENISKKNPNDIKNIFSDSSNRRNRMFLMYAVKTSVSYEVARMAKSRVAAANFIMDVLTSENASYILREIQSLYVDQMYSKGHMTNNFTVLLSKISKIENLDAESHILLSEMVKEIEDYVQERIEYWNSALDDAGRSGSSDRYTEAQVSKQKLQDLKDVLDSIP